MEEIVVLLVPAMLGLLLIRVLLLPLRGAVKLGIHCGCGFACLWLLNTMAPVTGIAFPLNAVTVLTAGTLGLPGIAALALLAVL